MIPNSCLLEEIKDAFMTMDWKKLQFTCEDMKNWLDNSEFRPEPTREQLRALLTCTELFANRQWKESKNDN